MVRTKARPCAADCCPFGSSVKKNGEMCLFCLPPPALKERVERNAQSQSKVVERLAELAPQLSEVAVERLNKAVGDEMTLILAVRSQDIAAKRLALARPATERADHVAKDGQCVEAMRDLDPTPGAPPQDIAEVASTGSIVNEPADDPRRFARPATESADHVAKDGQCVDAVRHAPGNISVFDHAAKRNLDPTPGAPVQDIVEVASTGSIVNAPADDPNVEHLQKRRREAPKRTSPIDRLSTLLEFTIERLADTASRPVAATVVAPTAAEPRLHDAPPLHPHFQEIMDQGKFGTCTLHGMAHAAHKGLLYKYGRAFEPQHVANVWVQTTRLRPFWPVDAAAAVKTFVLMNPGGSESLHVYLRVFKFAAFENLATFVARSGACTNTIVVAKNKGASHAMVPQAAYLDAGNAQKLICLNAYGITCSEPTVEVSRESFHSGYFVEPIIEKRRTLDEGGRYDMEATIPAPLPSWPQLVEATGHRLLPAPPTVPATQSQRAVA